MSDECLMKQETVFSFYIDYQAVMRKFTLAKNHTSVIFDMGTGEGVSYPFIPLYKLDGIYFQVSSVKQRDV